MAGRHKAYEECSLMKTNEIKAPGTQGTMQHMANVLQVCESSQGLWQGAAKLIATQGQSAVHVHERDAENRRNSTSQGIVAQVQIAATTPHRRTRRGS